MDSDSDFERSLDTCSVSSVMTDCEIDSLWSRLYESVDLSNPCVEELVPDDEDSSASVEDPSCANATYVDSDYNIHETTKSESKELAHCLEDPSNSAGSLLNEGIDACLNNPKALVKDSGDKNISEKSGSNTTVGATAKGYNIQKTSKSTTEDLCPKRTPSKFAEDKPDGAASSYATFTEVDLSDDSQKKGETRSPENGIERQQRAQCEQDRYVCGQCVKGKEKNKSQAVAFCVDCNEHLCQICAKRHEVGPNLNANITNHVIVNVKPGKGEKQFEICGPCNKENDKIRAIAKCVDCNEKLCQICVKSHKLRVLSKSRCTNHVVVYNIKQSQQDVATEFENTIQKYKHKDKLERMLLQ